MYRDTEIRLVLILQLSKPDYFTVNLHTQQKQKDNQRNGHGNICLDISGDIFLRDESNFQNYQEPEEKRMASVELFIKNNQ